MIYVYVSDQKAVITSSTLSQDPIVANPFPSSTNHSLLLQIHTKGGKTFFSKRVNILIIRRPNGSQPSCSHESLGSGLILD